MKPTIRTLIVDDSAFVRKVVREMLSKSPDIDVVGAARDGAEALEMARELLPDVITCDLLMPRMDGIEFVREQLARRRVPILILTATPQDGEKALEALDAGAVDIVQKPTALANDQLLTIQQLLAEKVRAAAQAKPEAMKLHPAVAPPAEMAAPRRIPVKMGVVVIGISTGGPQGLRYLLPRFPADFPVPVAIVLHMPVGYTELFAEKLNEISRLEVKEAKDGDELKPGRALLAQAGRHLVFRRCEDNSVRAELAVTPMDSPHRPAADVLFQSAAECYGSGVLGVVMTGMGDDGTRGASWIKAKGGVIITEAEESCIIYGMPRSVVEAGLSDVAVPLNKMAEAILERL